MNPETGELFDLKIVDDPLGTELQTDGEEVQEQGLVPVVRKLTDKERMTKQIELYSPCACGSGKKFKFCCKTTNTDPIKPFNMQDLYDSFHKKPEPEPAVEESGLLTDWESKETANVG